MVAGAPPSRLDRVLAGLPSYLAPALVALFSAAALWWLPAAYQTAPAPALGIQAVRDEGGRWDAATAREQLAAASPVALMDTRLAQDPFWLRVGLPARAVAPADGEPWALELPSRHATRLSCYDADSLRPLGSASRTGQDGAIVAVRSGFALNLAQAGQPQAVLCRAEFLGPARVTAQALPLADLTRTTLEFHRNAGLLEGGLVVLAAFILIAGLLNRQAHYLLFAAWLIINLRMAALSAGWDSQWLGRSIPPDWMPRLRAITLALYYAVTFALFTALFREHLARLRQPMTMRVLAFARWSCLPLLALALLLPYTRFLPAIWTMTGVGIACLAYLIGRLLWHTRSRVVLWYAASIGVALFASLYEVIAAALGVGGLIGAVNSVTAAIVSSLLTAVAVAEQMREEHRQRVAAQAELEHTYEVIPVGLFKLDASGRFLACNPAFQALLGQAVPVTGVAASAAPTDATTDWASMFGHDGWTALQRRLDAADTVEMEITGPMRPEVDKADRASDPAPSAATEATPSLPDDRRRTPRAPARQRFWLKATRVADTIEGTLQDVTDKARATAHLQFLANHDPLTRALNRRGIQTAMDEAIGALEQGQPLALAYLDLDRFKLINDLYGHAAGDEVLQQVCERIQRELPAGCRFGRIGGDEFLIVFAGTALDAAESAARRIVEAVGGQPYQVRDKAFQVRVSIGLIEAAPGAQAKDLVSTADRACREAKRYAATGLAVYDRQSHVFNEHEAEMGLVERLSAGETIEGMFLEMQPIMSLRSPHGSLNFEVLLRMRDGQGDRIPTERLIHAGENSGRMGVIDRWVLSSALTWLSNNGHLLRNNHFVCLNLSGASLNDERFMDDVYAMLERHRAVAPRLCLEITESVALHDLGNTRRFIDCVRSFGAKVALDDFGAGYTSFSYLKDLPADLLKIDGSFIVNMNQHPANVAIVEAIVSLAQNLGMKTIAEWAEDAATVETLAEIGVDYVQGFVVARPQRPERLLGINSGADLIEDESLKRYLSAMQPSNDALPAVDLVLGDAPARLRSGYPDGAFGT